MSGWVGNNFAPEIVDITGSTFQNLSYGTITFGVAIFVHSFYINRFRLSAVRICTDLACLSTILTLVCILKCTRGCTQLESDIYVNVLGNGLFSAIVQGCDNYITYARYACVVGDRVSTTQKWLTLAYVVVNLYFSWWPFFTVLPLFTDLNNNNGFYYYGVLQYYWNFPTYVAYNIFHTYLLCREIADRFDDGSEVALKIRLQAYRSIVHDAISILAIACYAFIPPLGTCLQVILIMFALHFVFNWKSPSSYISGRHAIALSNTDQKSEGTVQFAAVTTVPLASDEPPLVCRMINDGFDEADTRSVMPVLPGSEHDGDDVEAQVVAGSILIKSRSRPPGQLKRGDDRQPAADILYDSLTLLRRVNNSSHHTEDTNSKASSRIYDSSLEVFREEDENNFNVCDRAEGREKRGGGGGGGDGDGDGGIGEMSDELGLSGVGVYFVDDDDVSRPPSIHGQTGDNIEGGGEGDEVEGGGGGGGEEEIDEVEGGREEEEIPSHSIQMSIVFHPKRIHNA